MTDDEWIPLDYKDHHYLQLNQLVQQLVRTLLSKDSRKTWNEVVKEYESYIDNGTPG